MARIDEVIEGVERVRKSLCCYAGPTCDCKYGISGSERPGSEQTGCPELRDVLGYLRNLRAALSGNLLLTSAEWHDLQTSLDRLHR